MQAYKNTIADYSVRRCHHLKIKGKTVYINQCKHIKIQ